MNRVYQTYNLDGMIRYDCQLRMEMDFKDFGGTEIYKSLCYWEMHSAI